VSQPFISVVTPFHNTAPYLGQCIESVLGQTYREFEYILVDNCSTDGSTEIAESFARRDSRIRLLRRSQFLSQVQNYNRALAEISEASRYCKMVQADDYIFPDCLRSMLEVFEKSESIGLVSSYWLKGTEIRGSGFPHRTTIMPGKEVARLYLRRGLWVFGSPTAVMYRSSLIRKDQPFFDESRLHEDTEKCMQILEQWDFGFVHQPLSFSRRDNESISSAARTFQGEWVDRYIIVQRYAARFLQEDEATAVKKQSKLAYYESLALQAWHLREFGFWQYHKNGLKTLGEPLDWSYLVVQIARHGLEMASNPRATAVRALHFLRARTQQRNQHHAQSSVQA
jgi:glycosyltransferase involved in cell wall biosynthesis